MSTSVTAPIFVAPGKFVTFDPPQDSSVPHILDRKEKMKSLLLYLPILITLVDQAEFSSSVTTECPMSEHITVSVGSDGDQAMRIADEYGLGVCRDYKRERFWLRLAALLGNDQAARSLGETLTRPGPGSAEWYEGISLLMRSSAKGDAVSSMNLADALGSARGDTPVDQRSYWLARAAEQGSTTAMTEFARDVLNATTPMDEARFQEALKWADRSCRQTVLGSVGHKDACAVRDALWSVTESASAPGE